MRDLQWRNFGVRLADMPIWLKVHAPLPLVGTFLACVLLEAILGSRYVAVPFLPESPARWGLILPILTTATSAQFLKSGFAGWERRRSPRLYGTRFFSGLGVLALTLAPTLVATGALEPAGMLRNRLLFWVVIVTLSIVAPIGIAAIPLVFAVFTSMLLAENASNDSFPFLMSDSAGTGTLVALMVLAICAVALHAEKGQ